MCVLKIYRRMAHMRSLQNNVDFIAPTRTKSVSGMKSNERRDIENEKRASFALALFYLRFNMGYIQQERSF